MSDKHRFSSLMDDLGIVYDKTVSADLKRLYWDDLGHLPLEMIERAMQTHRRDPDRGRFWPKPADILHRCRDPRMIHPAPDAAWAIALESLDEAASVVMTDQIAQARTAALPVWLDGDKIGARMAFKAAYEQIVATTLVPPAWKFSPGHDAAKRAEAAERAVNQGLLTSHAVQRYLPAPGVTPDGAAIAGLLTGAADNVVGINSDVRSKLAKVREAITQSSAKTQREREEKNRRRHAQAEANHQRRHGPSQESA